MKTIVYLIFGFLCFSCASEEEQKAFKIIEDYYGTEVEFSKGFSKSMGKNDINTLNIDLKGGEFLKVVPPERLAPYAADLLNVNLEDEDVEKYSHIKVRLFEEETDTAAFYDNIYDVKTIQNISVKSVYFQEAADLLQKRAIDGLYDMLPSDHKSEADKIKFAEEIDKMVQQRGEISSIKLVGVNLIINNKTKKRYLDYQGLVSWANGEMTPIYIAASEDPTIDGMRNIDVL